MTPEHSEHLLAAFPNLYRKPFWGFECGDGWYNLLERLSARLETLILSEPEEERPQYYAAQVKQKFGGLRFYFAGCETKAMSEAIGKAEEEAWETCEECGEVGRQGCTKSGWFYVACDEHVRE